MKKPVEERSAFARLPLQIMSSVATTTQIQVAPKDTMLRTEQLYRSFTMGDRKVEVLRGINLQIMRGEVIFICGASGAGKSTLLYTLAGLERPELGKVFLNRSSLYELSAGELAKVRNREMGFIFQSYQLLSELTALENVLLPSLIAHERQRRRAEAILQEVGLGQRMHHMPTELSGGEQQRVAIARALVNEPSVIFADEPTGNLDSKNGEKILNVMLEMVRRNNRTLIVVTHDRSLAKFGDRTLEIADGQIVT